MKKFISTILAVLMACVLVFAAACGDDNNPSDGAAAYTITVTTQGGQPVQDVRIYMMLGDTTQDVDFTDENGQIVFNLDPAEYTVDIDEDTLSPGFTPERSSYITHSYSEEVNIVLESSVIDAEAPAGTVYSEGDVMYNFSYTEVETGETKTLLDAFEGKEMVMLNFFYTTCSPCLTETPLLQEAYAQYSDSVSIISISDYARDTADLVRGFKSGHNLTFDVVFDLSDDCVTKNFEFPGYPTNIIIDRYGVVCMVESGGITDVNVFLEWFEHYTGDDYVQDIGNDYELEIPDPSIFPETGAVLDAVKSSDGSLSADGRSFSVRWDDTSVYTWPWILSEGGGIQSANTNKRGSFSLVYFDFTIEKDGILAFDYKTSSELDSDIFYIFLDGEIIYSFSGSTQQDFETLYVYAGDGFEHELALSYVKDSGSDVGEDTIYVKNMRVTNEQELTENGATLNVLRQAATNLDDSDPSNPHYTEYVDAVLGSDGYYHVGSADGPMLFVEMRDDTLWNYGLFTLAYSAANDSSLTPSDPEYVLVGDNGENYSLIRKYAFYESCLLDIDMTPVTQELHDLLVDIVASLGDSAVDDENEWLELCRYYDQYGVPEEIVSGDPLLGLSLEHSVEFSGTGVESYEVEAIPKTPRGMFFSFTPEENGSYIILTGNALTSTGSNEIGTIIWMFDYTPGDDVLDPVTTTENQDGMLVTSSLDAGVTYYFGAALDDPNSIGTFVLSIVKNDADYVVRPAASNFYTGTGSEDVTLPTYINAVLEDDGYYHAYSRTNGSEYSLVLINVLNATSFSSYSLEELINGGEYEYTDSEGNTQTATLSPTFDWSATGYYATHHNAEYLACVPEEYRQDWTEYLQKYIDQAKAETNEFSGYVAANEELVEFLKILTALEGALTDNAWMQLAYYVEYFN